MNIGQNNNGNAAFISEGDWALSFAVSGCFSADTARADLNISFFDCAPFSREGLLSVMPCVVEEKIITVKEAMQTAYTWLEHAARSFTRWITVTAKAVRRRFYRMHQTCRTRLTCLTGVQILRRIAILRY